MQWMHERQVEETVGWFCRRAVPDAHDWHDATYDVQQLAKVDGRAWRVEVDIPTSADDVWLDFVVEDPSEGQASVSTVHAVRGSRHANNDTTYVWDDAGSAWSILGEDPSL